MTEEQVEQRLVELYPASSLDERRAISPLVVEFGLFDQLNSEAVMGTLYEWWAVLITQGREGMNLEGLLDYEWREYPGVKLCCRVTDMAVKWLGDGTPYLEPQRLDEPYPLLGFVEVKPDVWLRTRGKYAIAEGVPLLVD